MLYRYEATDQNGKTLRGALDAADDAAVHAELNRRGLRAVSVTVPTGSGASAPSSTPSTPARSGTTAARAASARDMALFFRQFAALSRAGISLFQALEELAPRTPHPGLSSVARQMHDAAQSGGAVSDVMERHPAVFPSHVVASVRAGETGGFIDIVLDEIALEYEQELAFYKGVWLPRMLVVQEVFAVALAQPMFPNILPDANWARYLLLAFGRNVPIGVALCLGVRWLARWMRSPRRRDRTDEALLRVPVFGDLARQRSLAAFIRALRRLYAAGLGPAAAWEGAMNVAPNAVIRARLNAAHHMMQQGAPLHVAFRDTGLFATEAEQFLATGVMAGQVVEMLDRVAGFYQDNVDRAFDQARFWMFRLASALFIATCGAVLIVMLKSYFDAAFRYADTFMP